MPDNHYKQYQDLGQVVYRNNLRSRRLRITIKPFENVKVTVPKGISYREAEKFLLERSDWVKKQLAKLDLYESEVKLALQKIEPIDKTKTVSFLQERTRQLADLHGFTINRVTVRNQKTRWGSCSSRRNINLNINLIQLPEELRDHVILHELVHTRIVNHSSRFWQELAKYSTEPKVKNKRLKEYQYLLYQKRK